MKRFIAFWLMPLPVCLVLLGAGLWFLRSERRQKLGKRLLFAGTILLMLFSNKAVSKLLVRPIEARYPSMPELRTLADVPPELARCRYIVVLGSGNGYSEGRPALSELSQAARARLGEAVRLGRLVPQARLIFSGPSINPTQPSHATCMARAAVSLGLEEARTQLVENVRDTEDESLAVRGLVGNEPFAVITSAWHMPRTMALFRAAGLQPLACPADFSAHFDGPFRVGDLSWDIEALERSTWAVRERIGYLWIWLRGKG